MYSYVMKTKHSYVLFIIIYIIKWFKTYIMSVYFKYLLTKVTI